MIKPLIGLRFGAVNAKNLNQSGTVGFRLDNQLIVPKGRIQIQENKSSASSQPWVVSWPTQDVYSFSGKQVTLNSENATGDSFYVDQDKIFGAGDQFEFKKNKWVCTDPTPSSPYKKNQAFSISEPAEA